MNITLKPNQTYIGNFDGPATIVASSFDVIFIHDTQNLPNYAVTVRDMVGGILSVGNHSYVNLKQARGSWAAVVGDDATLNSNSSGGYIHTGRSEYNNSDLVGAHSTVKELGNNTTIVTSKGNTADIAVKGSGDRVALNSTDSLIIGGNGQFAASNKIDSVQVLSASYGPIVKVTADSNVTFNAPFVSGPNKGAVIQLYGNDQVTLGNNDTVTFNTASGQDLDIINNFNSTDHLNLSAFNIASAADLLANHVEYYGHKANHPGGAIIHLGADSAGHAQDINMVGPTAKIFAGLANNNFIYHQA